MLFELEDVTATRAGRVVFELEDGFKVYFAGDTNAFGDMAMIRRLYEPEVAVLPIGGHYTMDPREAAVALEFLGVKKCIPCHYGTFPILAGTPDELRAALERRGIENVTVHACEPGQQLS